MGFEPAYGISIMTIYRQMLTWLIPQRLVAAGLLAAPKPAPTQPTPSPAPTASGSAPRIIAPATTTPRRGRNRAGARRGDRAGEHRSDPDVPDRPGSGLVPGQLGDPGQHPVIGA